MRLHRVLPWMVALALVPLVSKGAEACECGIRTEIRIAGEGAKFVMVGNPTGPGRFQDAFEPGSGCAALSASCFEHPNVMRVYDFGKVPDGSSYVNQLNRIEEFLS